MTPSRIGTATLCSFCTAMAGAELNANKMARTESACFMGVVRYGKSSVSATARVLFHAGLHLAECRLRTGIGGEVLHFIGIGIQIVEFVHAREFRVVNQF